MNIRYKFAPWCVVIVYLSVHRAEPLTGLPGVRQKAHPDPPPRSPPPRIPRCPGGLCRGSIVSRHVTVMSRFIFKVSGDPRTQRAKKKLLRRAVLKRRAPGRQKGRRAREQASVCVFVLVYICVISWSMCVTRGPRAVCVCVREGLVPYIHTCTCGRMHMHSVYVFV